MRGRTGSGSSRKQQLAQFFFEGRECHSCDIESLDAPVRSLLIRLSYTLLRCREYILHAGISLRIRIALRNETATVSEIENWPALPAGLQQLLISELGLEPRAIGRSAGRAA